MPNPTRPNEPPRYSPPPPPRGTNSAFKPANPFRGTPSHNRSFSTARPQNFGTPAPVERRSDSKEVQAISQIIGEGNVIRLSNGQDYQLKKILGNGNFGITFSGTAVNDTVPLALKFQPFARSHGEAEMHRKIEDMENPCDQVINFIDAGSVETVLANNVPTANPGIQFHVHKAIDMANMDVNAQAMQRIQLWTAQNLIQRGDPQGWQLLVDLGAAEIRTEAIGCTVMELAEGQALTKINPMKSLSFDEIGWAIKIIKEIAVGIEYLHKRGYVHGDLKPDNVILNEDDTVRIVDFSTSFEIGAPPRPDQVIATSFYEPRLLHQYKVLGKYSDVYSLIFIFYRLVTGREPADVDLMQHRVSRRQVQLLKYWAWMPALPPELRKTLYRIFRNEIVSINLDHMATSLVEMEERQSSTQWNNNTLWLLPNVEESRNHNYVSIDTIEEAIDAIEKAYIVDAANPDKKEIFLDESVLYQRYAKSYIVNKDYGYQTASTSGTGFNLIPIEPSHQRARSKESARLVPDTVWGPVRQARQSAVAPVPVSMPTRIGAFGIFLEYITDVRVELSKVSWPYPEDVFRLTRIVIGTIITMSIFLGLADTFFTFFLVTSIQYPVIIVILAILAAIAYKAYDHYSSNKYKRY